MPYNAAALCLFVSAISYFTRFCVLFVAVALHLYMMLILFNFDL